MYRYPFCVGTLCFTAAVNQCGARRYLLLPEVLSQAETARLLARLRELEAAEYADSWVEELGLDRSKVALTKQSSSADYQGL